jgi:hypothetical protein
LSFQEDGSKFADKALQNAMSHKQRNSKCLNINSLSKRWYKKVVGL